MKSSPSGDLPTVSCYTTVVNHAYAGMDAGTELAGLAESVDAGDLKSSVLWTYEFESRIPHHIGLRAPVHLATHWVAFMSLYPIHVWEKQKCLR